MQLYQPLGIRIVLTRSITFTAGDMFAIQPDPEPLLNSFTSYVRNTLASVEYDSAMLIT